MIGEIDRFREAFPNGLPAGISVLRAGTDDCAFVYADTTRQLFVSEWGEVAPYTGGEFDRRIDGAQVNGERRYVDLQDGRQYCTEFHEAGEEIILGIVSAIDGILHTTETSLRRHYLQYITQTIKEDMPDFKRPCEPQGTSGLDKYNTIIAYLELPHEDYVSW